MNQRELYNTNILRTKNPIVYREVGLEFEKKWIAGILKKFSHKGEEYRFCDWKTAKLKFKSWIEEQKKLEDPDAEYVADVMSYEEFRVLVKEFSLDGLTEAQVFYYIMPRLPLSAQLPMLRIMIDEFGSGNFSKTHTNLYVHLLEEMELPICQDDLLVNTEQSTFALLNLFYWFTLRADDASYFVGALTYFESLVPTLFEFYEKCCHRLSVRSHHYYSEHCHIDKFHAFECFKVMDRMEEEGCLDISKARIGMEMASHIVCTAFSNAVSKAKSVVSYNSKVA